MLKCCKDFFKNIACKPMYFIPVVLITILAYGVSLTSNTLSVDDTSFELYHGLYGYMVMSTRWGMEVWHMLMGTFIFTPFIYKFFAIVFLLTASFLLCCVFYSLDKSVDKIYPYALCSCIFATYPLMNEIWEYNGANSMVCGNLMIVMFVVLYQLHNDPLKLKSMLISSSLLTLVVSSYESASFVYVSLVISVIFYKYCVLYSKNQKKLSWIVSGLKFVPALIIAIIIRFFVGFALIKVLGLYYQQTGDTGVFWREVGNLGYLKYLIASFLLRLSVFFPYSIFLLFTTIFFVYIVYKSIKKRSVLPVLMGIILEVSVFSQTFLQLAHMPNRTAHTMMFFCAFVTFILCRCSTKLNIKLIRNIVIIFLTILSIQQASYVGKLLQYNCQRSENESAIINQLGFEIKSKYSEKPIVVCGAIDLGDYYTKVKSKKKNVFVKYLTDNFRTLDETYNSLLTIETNVNSVINWSSTAFNGQKMMKTLFSYHGYDFDFVYDETFIPGFLGIYAEAKDIANQYNMKPLEIKDMGDYILVYLGDG